VGLWGDPRVTRLIDARTRLTRDEVRELLHQHITCHEQHGVQYWPFFRRATGMHLGCCGLRPRRAEDGVFELGFQVRADHWGRGYASEATAAVIGYARAHPDVREIFAGHHPENTASAHVLRKLGFRYTHEERYEPTGLMHPCYELTLER